MLFGGVGKQAGSVLVIEIWPQLSRHARGVGAIFLTDRPTYDPSCELRRRLPTLRFAIGPQLPIQIIPEDDRIVVLRVV